MNARKLFTQDKKFKEMKTKEKKLKKEIIIMLKYNLNTINKEDKF